MSVNPKFKKGQWIVSKSEEGAVRRITRFASVGFTDEINSYWVDRPFEDWPPYTLKFDYVDTTYDLLASYQRILCIK